MARKRNSKPSTSKRVGGLLVTSDAGFARVLKAIANRQVRRIVAEERAKIGRPTRDGTPSKTFSMRATTAEIAAWRAHAKRVKADNLVAWIREVCNGAAGGK